MKRLLALMIIMAFAAIAPSHAALAGRQAASSGRRTILIVHGWAGEGDGQAKWDDVYGQLKTTLEGNGFTVYGPILPYTGSQTGDTIKNATWLRQYVLENHLTNVLMVGHSLGGFVAEYYMRYLDTGEVTAYATLDSNVNNAGPKGLTCLLYPPDSCRLSALRITLALKAARNDVFLLNLWATELGNQPQVDCSRYIPGTHASMVGQPATIQDLEQEATGVNPCTGKAW